MDDPAKSAKRLWNSSCRLETCLNLVPETAIDSGEHVQGTLFASWKPNDIYFQRKLDKDIIRFLKSFRSFWPKLLEIGDLVKDTDSVCECWGECHYAFLWGNGRGLSVKNSLEYVWFILLACRYKQTELGLYRYLHNLQFDWSSYTQQQFCVSWKLVVWCADLFFPLAECELYGMRKIWNF